MACGVHSLSGCGTSLVDHFPADLLDIDLLDVAHDVAPDPVVSVPALDHLSNRRFLGPPLLDDAKHRRHESGAIRAMFAMDEKRAVACITEQPQNADDMTVLNPPRQHVQPLIEQPGAGDAG